MIKRYMMASRGRYKADGSIFQHAELREDGDKICSGLTSVQKDTLVLVYRIPCRMVGRNPEHPTSREVGIPTTQMIEPRDNPKTSGALTSATKDNMVLVYEKINSVD